MARRPWRLPGSPVGGGSPGRRAWLPVEVGEETGQRGRIVVARQRTGAGDSQVVGVLDKRLARLRLDFGQAAADVLVAELGPP